MAAGHEGMSCGSFAIKSRSWKNGTPGGVATPVCGVSPCTFPARTVPLTYGERGVIWALHSCPGQTRQRVAIAASDDLPARAGQNRAMGTPRQAHDVALLVLGARGGDVGEASVYAMRHPNVAKVMVSLSGKKLPKFKNRRCRQRARATRTPQNRPPRIHTLRRGAGKSCLLCRF